jgi:hypothetical protein
LGERLPEKTKFGPVNEKMLEYGKLIFKLSETGKLHEIIEHSRNKEWDAVKKICKELNLSPHDCQCLYDGVMYYLYDDPPGITW